MRSLICYTDAICIQNERRRYSEYCGGSFAVYADGKLIKHERIQVMPSTIGYTSPVYAEVLTLCSLLSYLLTIVTCEDEVTIKYDCAAALGFIFNENRGLPCGNKKYVSLVFSTINLVNKLKEKIRCLKTQWIPGSEMKASIINH